MFIGWYDMVNLARLEPHAFDARYPPQAIPLLPAFMTRE
jgi:hypothetical protein